MNRLVALLVLVLGVCALPARAALVYDGYPTGPGGLSIPYPTTYPIPWLLSGTPEVYAGLIELTGGSGTILAMSSDRNTLSHTGESWTMTNYSYAEVQAGAPVRFTPAQYARAAYQFNNLFNYQNVVSFFPSLRVAAEAMGNDTLADLNAQVWDIMASTSCPVLILGMYWDCQPGIDTFDWSTLMAVASGGPGRDEYLIPLASQGLILGPVTVGPVVPVPPAFWLLGSGLLGLAGVARKRHGAPR